MILRVSKIGEISRFISFYTLEIISFFFYVLEMSIVCGMGCGFG